MFPQNPMLVFDLLAERRILAAIEAGELDDLPGTGRPVEFDDELFVSPEQRMVNRILKNAGMVPADVSMRQAIARLRREIRGLPEGNGVGERKRQELVYLLLKSDEERWRD